MLKRTDKPSVRWFDLRHTWTIWHVQAGTHLNSKQEGWSNYEKVLRYAHLAPEHLYEYANNILDNGGHIKYPGIKKQSRINFNRLVYLNFDGGSQAIRALDHRIIVGVKTFKIA